MKSSLALIIGIAALLAGCGQTGPLYMPTPPAKPAAPLAAPAIPVSPPSSLPSEQR
ncbi:LPS translocon maturation chaperone LptM [Massilia sp. TWR1-2-2]|uniref:LPS translocon maturation chaperone LptM n=1 Tax=Massilia sp. TWR1-2-2 TaxID=2804584 RepID=UPI003CF12EB8